MLVDFKKESKRIRKILQGHLHHHCQFHKAYACFRLCGNLHADFGDLLKRDGKGH